MIDRCARSGLWYAAGAAMGSAMVLSLIAGCASSSTRAAAGDEPDRAGVLSDGPASTSGDEPAAPDGTSLEALMARTMSGMEQYEAGLDGQPVGERGVGRGADPRRGTPGRPVAQNDEQQPVDAGLAGLAGAMPDAEDAVDPPIEDAPRTFGEVARELAELAAARASDSNNPIGDALVLAALEAAVDGQGRWLGGRMLAGLSPDERRAAEAVRAAIADIQSGTNAADAFDHAAAAVGAERSLTISRAALCTRVEGFGRYEPFPRDVFLAGRRLRMLVYTEIDGFHAKSASLSGGDPGWEVELSQELLLYHDADGTLAWQQPPRTSQFRARTRPRDYFVVNQVVLPSNLTIGSYHLKVVMTDRATGAVDEMILPIQVVADAKLANRP